MCYLNSVFLNGGKEHLNRDTRNHIAMLGCKFIPAIEDDVAVDR